MDSYELSERLEGSCMPVGRIREWARLTACAEDDLKRELLSALEGSTELRKQTIVAAACDGTGKGTILGIGGSINQEAVRYIRFVLSVVDTAMATKLIEYGDDLTTSKVVSALQKSFEWTMKASSGTMDESASRFGKASLVFLAANGNPFFEVAQEQVAYLAGHYDALEPYLSFIIQTRDMSRSQLNMLLTTKPVVPLTGGLL